MEPRLGRLDQSWSGGDKHVTADTNPKELSHIATSPPMNRLTMMPTYMLRQIGQPTPTESQWREPYFFKKKSRFFLNDPIGPSVTAILKQIPNVMSHART
jgi:hypothetical protein